MFNQYELPVLLNALAEYEKIAVNVEPQILKNIKSKLVQFLDGTSIASVWSVEDVYSLGETDDDGEPLETNGGVTLDEAKEVLRLAESEHDASIGINWETLQYWLDEVRGQ